MTRFRWGKRIGKRRIAQILVVIGIVLFVIRESRILWGIEGAEYFDLTYWGIYISEEIYTLQNLMGIVGGLILLVALTQTDSLKVVLHHPIHAPENFRETNPKRQDDVRRRETSVTSPLKLLFQAEREDE